ISAAVLTKANGWAVPLAVVFALVLLGDWKRFLSARMWTCGALVAVLCVPYYAFTFRMTRAGLEGRSLSWERSWGALTVYASEFPAAVGIPVALLFVAGVVAKFLLPLWAGRLTRFWAMMAGYVAAVLVFHVLVPTAAEARKSFMALPAALLFVAAGIPRAARGRLVAALALGAFAVWTFHIPRQDPSLMREAALRLVSQPGSNPAVVLVAGTSETEGSLIAEFAALDPGRPAHYVLRASKQLFSMTWNGLDYRSRYQTAAEIQAALESVPVRFLVVHSVRGQTELQHERLLRTLLTAYAAEWRQIHSATGASGRETVRVFRRTKDLDGRPIRFEVDLEDKLGATLKTGF
ncbi:MAG: hypothetical protein HY822_13970, partial [Acidobacteria bacterium]|nr:hypothetical protein [Acidobacteriota bacterium]